MWDVTNTPSCKHNVFVVSHEIVRPNEVTPPTGQTEQTPTSGSRIGFDTICNDPTQPCRYCPLQSQGAFTALKCVYQVKKSSYLYSTRKFLPYPTWDVTNTPPPPPPPWRHNVLVVSHGIIGPNKQTKRVS